MNSKTRCHSRESGNPGDLLVWIPACAGMTKRIKALFWTATPPIPLFKKRGGSPIQKCKELISQITRERQLSRRFFYLIMTDQAEGPFVPLCQGLLRCLSVVYAQIVKFHKFLYTQQLLKTVRLAKPVISVGNITVGGTGKTPLIETIAHWFMDRQLRPVILMRGYGAGREYLSGKTQALENDEAKYLKSSLNIPVIVGRDRVKGARQFLKKDSCDVFLLDDGFQHRRVYRDLDIVAVDATNPFGNEHLLPRGTLREPLAELARADVLVMTRSDLGKDRLVSLTSRLKSFVKETPIVESVHRVTSVGDLFTEVKIPIPTLQSAGVGVFCAIGNPESFKRTVMNLGMQIKKCFVFMDHHWYRRDDIEQMINDCQRDNIQILVTTTKDAAKLGPYRDYFNGRLRCYVLNIEIEFTKGKEALFERINHIVQR